MTELLPGVQSSAIRDGILDYLSTTFALTDEDARATLVDFLSDRESGIFKGPYLRVRLPFKPADDGWRDALEWYDGPKPYGHQAQAFQRLSSLGLNADRPRPLPTLVTTGTGSGKTESFLYPIIDHVLRVKRQGVTGTKALILYPMNALANDQAQRLASIITTHPELSAVTAALYTGEEGAKRKRVTSDGLINDRSVIRRDPPDILLTNYKMLDQMLLREHDAPLWAKSATSLQYLVLDEFHTYDGAQGTDVSMLLRRLGIALKSYWPDDAFTAEDRARPLGIITPVATSATLGDKGDPAAMLGFAETVFGETFTDDSVITESRLSYAEWATRAEQLEPRIDREAIEQVIARAGAETDGRRIAEWVFRSLFITSTGGAVVLGRATPEDLLVLAKSHPFTETLAELAEQAAPISDIAEQLLPNYVVDEPTRDAAETFVLLYSAALSHIRKVVGRDALSVDLHLWIRELSRIDREAIATPRFLWSDDTYLGGSGLEENSGAPAFPAIFCRHCGSSGWAVLRAPVGGFDLMASDPNHIRKARFSDVQDFRALMHAPVEASANADQPPSLLDEDEPQLMWFVPSQLRVLATAPEEDADVAAGRVLPVLAHTGKAAGTFSVTDTCPSCMQKDGIRFLGSAIATLLSVSLSTIFGSDDLDAAEKKALVFTDSVQDAAHRAGFIQSRSHSLTLRAVLRGAVGEQPISLDLLVDRAMQQAGDDPHKRYRLIPPDFADRKEFDKFWQRDKQSEAPAAVRRRVKRRLLLDTILEFGMQSRLGRTLELTGTLAAEVEVSRGVMLRVATEVERKVGPQYFEGMGTTDDQRVSWVRGVLERMRTDGAIQHEWFTKYQVNDGNRHSIWGGRPRSDGMPAFPRGRGAPAYPRVGGARSEKDIDLVSVGSPKSWYAIWTARALGCTPHEGASLAVELLAQLAAFDAVKSVNTNSGGRVYELPQSRVVVAAVDDDSLSRGDHALTCDQCQSSVPGTRRVIDELDGQPCFVIRCSGKLWRSGGNPANFYRWLYRASDITRVVAREHTSLLEDVVRLEYETQFKQSVHNPQAPNVLVATPTLEMGIDIGDLSTVMLASLPRSVSSYLQRVGRAGRLTGSALNLAFVSGRGEQLPRLGDPLSVINGQVRPPATYIDAEEILRRQYVAAVADRLARSVDAPHPATATQAIGSVDPGSYLRAIIETAEDPATIREFLDVFDALNGSARDRLTTWATPTEGALSSQLSHYLHERRHHWNQQVEALKFRKAEIDNSLPELRERAALPAATDEDKVALRTATAALRLVAADLERIGVSEYWISVLEAEGIFPNYTLIDDSVTLDVTLSWVDPDTQEYMTEPSSFTRSAAHALREFAPGATFYGRGYKIEVDAIELGANAEAIRTMVFCPSCGFNRNIEEGGAPTACPRCGDPAIADMNQRIDTIELERVSSVMRREEATIDDRRDDRERVRFDVIATADVHDPQGQWFIDGYPFGLKHLTNMTIRWVNVGKAVDPGAGSRMISGAEHRAPLFRVCVGCGKLDSRTGRNTAAEHRPWCAYRNKTQENIRQIALTRTLRTEGLVIQIPATISVGDRFALPSLLAALQLGLREHLGGAPDHLAFDWTVDPHLSDGSENQEAILIHDRVPGGTGYLAEFSDPEKFYDLLYRAWVLVRDCPCQEEGRASCHRCLSPYMTGSTQEHISRLSAERHLRTLLLGGRTENDPSATCDWQVTEQQTTPYEPETHIEQRFRKILQQRLVDGIGASVQEHPGPNGNRWNINASGGRTWVLEPQMALGFVKPDFVLYSNDQNLPRIAIFCDGWQYHASPVNNRIADDAAKRASLRAEGYMVIGLTWQDLDDAETRATTPPPWFDPASVPTAVHASDGRLKPGLVELVSGGPIDFLVKAIADPDPDGIEALADAIPLLFVKASVPGTIHESTDLTDIGRELLDGGAVHEGGDRRIWAWSYGPLVAVGCNRVKGTLATECMIMLDDRNQRLGRDTRSAWREWIRLANLLNRRVHPTAITAYSASSVGVQPGAADEPSVAAVELTAPWTAVLESAASPAERAVLVLLAGDNAPMPTIGHETADGLPIGVSWPDMLIAVDIDLDEDGRAELVAGGWQIVAPDREKLEQALSNAGGK